MFRIVTCFMYPRVFTKEGSCGDCCLSCDSPQNNLGLGPLKALIRPWVGQNDLHSSMHRNFTTVSCLVAQFSPKCSEIYQSYEKNDTLNITSKYSLVRSW